eukprot:g1938.t1
MGAGEEDGEEEGLAKQAMPVILAAAADEERWQLLFSLAELYHRQQNYSAAFSTYVTAHEVQAADPRIQQLVARTTNSTRTGATPRDVFCVPHFQQAHLLVQVQVQMLLQARALDRPAAATFSDITPVFVVGMPRSGTTLVEALLVAHPEATTIHESALLPELWARWEGASDSSTFNSTRTIHTSSTGSTRPKVLSAEQLIGLADAAEAYMTEIKLAALEAGAHVKFVVDKNVYNHRRLRAIHLLFPTAKVIVVRRDPRDTALSIFRAAFSHPKGFEGNFTTIAEQYADFLVWINQSRRHFAGATLPAANKPLQMLETNYEDVVQHPEPTVRAILEFVGMEWDPRVLAFYRISTESNNHNNEHGHPTEQQQQQQQQQPTSSLLVTGSASFMAVRRPLHSRGVGKSAKYVPVVGPLLGDLGAVVAARFAAAEEGGGLCRQGYRWH